MPWPRIQVLVHHFCHGQGPGLVLLLRHDGLTQDDGADAGFADVLLIMAD